MKVITDLSVTSRPHRPRVQWSPAELFGGGAIGAWYDPSDMTTLFQDAGGTIPVTASGQPLGLILEKSGNAMHAQQSVAAARPIYTVGAGRHWLEFDGVDDRLQIASSRNLNGETAIFRIVEPPSRTAIGSLISPSAAGYVAISGSGAGRSLGKNDSATIRAVDAPAHFPITASSAVGIRITGGTIHARRWPDPTEYANSLVATSNLNYTNTLMAFSETESLPVSGKLFGVLLFEAALPLAELNLCLTFINRKVAP